MFHNLAVPVLHLFILIVKFLSLDELNDDDDDNRRAKISADVRRAACRRRSQGALRRIAGRWLGRAGIR